MSVIKQPFQMLPFSQSIESQFRLRSDCFNDLCDVPIIPKGHFVPFFIIADSDVIGDVTLHCWDDPFEYTHSEYFTKEGCLAGEGSTLLFSKTYYSTISIDDARNQAQSDTNFYIEGQQYANDNGTCETFYALDYNDDIFTDYNDDRFMID